MSHSPSREAPTRTGLAVVLGLMIAIGPFAIDMYLPALPLIGRYFGTSSSWAQASLGVFFLCFGASQLLYGPWSDRVGRHPPLIFGLLVFIAGSAGCALAPNMPALIAFRCLQGMGAGAMAVIPRAIVRDLYTGVAATRMMARLMMVFSVSPILAPLSGSLVLQYLPWQSIFVWTGLFALIGLLLTRLVVPETRPRGTIPGGPQRQPYRRLLGDTRFLLLAAISALASSGFYLYLSGSAFVLISHYHLSSRQFSVAFSINAFSMIGCSQLSPRLARRYGLPRVLMGAVSGYAAVMSLLWLLTWQHEPGLALLLSLLVLGYGALGLITPCTTVLALDAHGASAGSASALLGTLQMATGALVMALISPFVNGHPLPMVAGIALCALSALALAALGWRRGYLRRDIIHA